MLVSHITTYVVSSIFKVKVMAKCQWTQSKSLGNACYYSKFYRCGKYPIIQNLFYLETLQKLGIFKVKVMAKCQWTNSKSWEAHSFFSSCNFFYSFNRYLTPPSTSKHYKSWEARKIWTPMDWQIYESCIETTWFSKNCFGLRVLNGEMRWRRGQFLWNF